MEISVDLVKDLRNRTGVSISDCKKALVETDGDIQKATEYLRKKGAATATKRADKVAKEGAVKSLISKDKKSGSIIEINQMIKILYLKVKQRMNLQFRKSWIL
jgi:elongation factor Ts